jgi:hypothetical protein
MRWMHILLASVMVVKGCTISPELAYGGGETDEIGFYYSSEVTSINSSVPFIALITGATHAVVANGGSWHLDDDSGFFVWDTVLTQDPIAGPNVSYLAGQWTDAEVTHIISAAASEEANTNFNNYGSKVALRGSGGVIRGPLPD